MVVWNHVKAVAMARKLNMPSRNGVGPVRSPLVVGAVEELESRRLYSAVSAAKGGAARQSHADALVAPVVAAKPVKNHVGGWYKPAKTVTLPAGPSATAATPTRTAQRLPVNPATFSVNAAGLPLLTSRADGQGLKVFLDFDGYGTDIPFDLSVASGGDGNGATFNTFEQQAIYETWRDVVSYYSMLNVNVTTIQPPTGGTNPDFVWHRISDSVNGAAAYVGAINNYSSMGWSTDGFALDGAGGIAHEIGHQLNITHQADWSDDGVKINEYGNGDPLHPDPIMGGGDAVGKWAFGRNSDAPDRFQDDLPMMTAYMSQHGDYGDGYRPDDYAGTTFATATPLTLKNGSYQTTGSIERMTDTDIFRFTSTGGRFNINAVPTFESAATLKIELYDADGKLIAAKDDTALRGSTFDVGTEFSLDLPAGTYYAKLASHGGYGDLGEYAFYASPLPAGFTAADVRADGPGRGGYVSYDSTNGGWQVGGGGTDIHGTSDSFHYVYQTLTGNGSITARVSGVDNTQTFAKAGVMLRETLSPASRHAFNYFTPTASETAVRYSTGGDTQHQQLTRYAPAWVRLTRVGDTITLYNSLNGTTFSQIGSPMTLSSLASQVYIGLAVTSHDRRNVANAGFTNVTLTGTLGTTPATVNGLAAPGNLTAAPVNGPSTAVNLAWADGAGETGYAVERSVDGVTWAQVGTTAADVTTYTDNLAFGSMRWWYRVSAVDGTGKSRVSAAVTVVNKPARPAKSQLIRTSTIQQSISWQDVSGETGYLVERSENGGPWGPVATLDANITGYNSNDLIGFADYAYRITPLNAETGNGIPLTIDASAAPTVSYVLVNDGSGQRSMVKSLTVQFSRPVNVAAGGLTIQERLSNGTYADLPANSYTVTPATAGDYVTTYLIDLNPSGPSIADGEYRLSAAASKVTSSLGLPLTAFRTENFFRLFGDADGDYGVSINDFNRLAAAFGTVAGSASFDKAFDYDNDDGISIDDFNQFATRFGETVF